MKENRIFALGFFDGVHLGHQALLNACVQLANELDAETAAITFTHHPQSLYSNQIPPLLSTLRDRFRLLMQYGMEHIYEFPVTKEVMSTDWRSFLDELIVCGGAGFVCGDDFRFGHKGEGNAQKLQQFCAERGLPCVIVPEQTMDGEKISSTRIRTLLEQGNVENANRLLGHAHRLSGKVVSGKGLGRTIGIPTANLCLPKELVCPAFGVYACKAIVDGNWFNAVTNIGTRPTVDGQGVTIEPWILDFDGDLYGKEITLEFRKFLRPEQKFNSLEELKTQIHIDALNTDKLLK